MDDGYTPAPQGQGPDFTVGEAIGEGHKLLMANYGLMLGASIVVLLLTLAAMVVAGLADGFLVGPDAMFQPVTTATQFLVQTPLGIGIGMLAARRYRDNAGSFEDIFIGFTRYWQVVVIGLIMTVGVMVVALAGVFGGALVVGGIYLASPAAAIVVAILLYLVFLVALVYLAMRLWFAYLICVDPRGARPGPIDSIKLSWYMTSGHVFKLWLTGVAMGLIGILCVLLLVLPFVFYALPLIGCITGVLYVLVNPMPPEGEFALDGYEPVDPAPVA
jgi:hypothetical protein